MIIRPSQYTQLLIDPLDPVRVIDSAPIPACTYTRNSHCETVLGPEYMSVMASKKAKLGHRFYATASLDQVIGGWMLAPAAPNDGKMAPAFVEDQADLLVFGDNAFHGPDEIAWLKSERNVILINERRAFCSRNSQLEFKAICKIPVIALVKVGRDTEVALDLKEVPSRKASSSWLTSNFACPTCGAVRLDMSDSGLHCSHC